jgi:hypothetical protein
MITNQSSTSPMTNTTSPYPAVALEAVVTRPIAGIDYAVAEARFIVHGTVTGRIPRPPKVYDSRKWTGRY